MRNPKRQQVFLPRRRELAWELVRKINLTQDSGLPGVHQVVFLPYNNAGNPLGS
jgi:hypothetical protein